MLHRQRLIVFGGVADSLEGGDAERLIEGDHQLVVFEVDQQVARLTRVAVASTGERPRPRRAHAAWLAGQTMLVCGGFIATVPEIQRDLLDAIDAASALYALDLETWTWSRVDVKPTFGPPLTDVPASEELARRAARGVALAGCCVVGDTTVIVGGISATIGLAGGVAGYSASEPSWVMFRDVGARHVVHNDEAWTPRCSSACAAYGDRFVVLFGGSAVQEEGKDLNDVVVFDIGSAPRVADVRRIQTSRAPAWKATAEASYSPRVPAKRNAASMTSVTSVGGLEVLVLFGGGVYPHTYYNDTHVLHLTDLPAASTTLERPPPPLANLCQAAVATEITDQNVFEMLMFADDRQLADLRTACLAYVQQRGNPLFADVRHPGGWSDIKTQAAMEQFRKSHHADMMIKLFVEDRRNGRPNVFPGYDAAIQAPSLKSDVERALRGI